MMGGRMTNTIRRIITVLFLCLWSALLADNEKILVFRDAKPYDGHIAAIKAGIAMIKTFGAANKFSVDTTASLSSFNTQNLAQYDAVVFMHPYRDVNGELLNDTMNASEDAAFKSYMLSGKGMVGIHCADRLNNNSPWYLNLLGAQYLNDIGPQTCTYHVANPNHPMTSDITQAFTNSQQVRCNNLFFNDTSKEFTILIKADQKDYPTGQKQAFYPYVWMHDYKGARVWCGSMGHTPETFSSDQIWRKLMLRGILYAINRSGYTNCAERVPRLVFQNTGKKNPFPGRGIYGSFRIFDLAGRTINGSRPIFQPYIVAPDNVNRSPAVFWSLKK
jgi:type 1 glutamine amidotransferase